jgi:molybdopterin-guanine dinucleotide biosynthesis protein A
MLTRVLRLLGEVVRPIVVVAAADQELPPLPDGTLVARDERPGRGPLEGLRAGLSRFADRVDAVYATSCDVPLLAPGFVRRMIEFLEDYDIAVPTDGEFHHPLSAVYRVDVLAKIEALLAADRLRPGYLFDETNTRRVPVEELRRVDPQLHTLANVNRPADYFAALADAGFSATDEIRRRLPGPPG